jgi:hypothetical protein
MDVHFPRRPGNQATSKLVGVLAQADVARDADPQQTGQMVEEISE